MGQSMSNTQDNKSMFNDPKWKPIYFQRHWHKRRRRKKMTDKEYEKLEKQYLKEKTRRDNIKRLETAITGVINAGKIALVKFANFLHIQLTEDEGDAIYEQILIILEDEKNRYTIQAKEVKEKEDE